MAFAYVAFPFTLFFIVWFTLARYNLCKGKSAVQRHALGFFWGVISWAALIAILVAGRWYTDAAGFVFVSYCCWSALSETVKTK